MCMFPWGVDSLMWHCVETGDRLYLAWPSLISWFSQTVLPSQLSLWLSRSGASFWELSSYSKE